MSFVVVTHLVFSPTGKLCPNCGEELVKNLAGEVKCSKNPECDYKCKWENLQNG